MVSVIDFNKHKKSMAYEFKNEFQEKYFLEVVDIIVNEEIHSYVYIFKREKDGFSRITPYSRYFTGRVLKSSLINNSKNTQVNAHGKFIVCFLNYIFYERKNGISSINQIDRDLILEFLRKYAMGETSTQKGKWIKKENSVRAGRAIMRFVYWLKYTSVEGERFRLTKISKDDFDIVQKQVNRRRTVEDGEVRQSHYIVESIDCPPDFKKTSKYNSDRSNNETQKREKAINISLFTVKLLIDTSAKRDPEMVFPIVLGAFVGLRQGDVVQMHRGRINLPFDLDITENCTIDLLNEVQISDNTNDCGYIKTHRVQPIYEGFIPIVHKAYRDHLGMLEQRGLTSHKYGAFFFNSNGNGVMKQQSLNRRFKKIADEVVSKIKYEAVIKKNVYAINEYNVLEKDGFEIKFHSLRHYYTHALEKFENDPYVLMRYRGDNALESQNTYRSNRPIRETIRKVMDEMKGELKGYGFTSILPGE